MQSTLVQRLSLSFFSQRLAALLLCLATPSVIASENDNQRLLEELTVTAQKRPERLQNVPISMSVVSMDTIRELNLFDFEELTELIPGSSVNRGLQSASIQLRGVGSGAFTVNAPESVAIFVDQFPQSRAGAVFATLHDVERVTVLRGPQGTLYGQNASVGVFNINTRAPDTDLVSGNIRASYAHFDGDSDLESIDVRGAVNLPLVRDSLGVRLSGVYRDAEGFAKARNPLASFDAGGGRELQAMRARLLWLPGSQSQLTWTVNVQEITDYPISGNLDGQVPGTGGSSEIRAQRTRFQDREYWGETRGVLDGRLQDVGLHWLHEADWSLVEFLASYQSFQTDAVQNRRPFVGGGDNFLFEANYDIATLELRASRDSDQFDYVAGLYAYDKAVEVDVDLALGSSSVFAAGKETTQTLAAFGNVNYHVTEHWDLTMGLRWDSNDVSADYNTGFDANLSSRLDDRNGFEHVSWSMKLLWYPRDRTTLYLALDNATKQGGYNPLLSAADIVRDELPEVAEIAADNLRYSEEDTTAFEAGIKGAALGERFRYTLAAFYQVFDDYQLTHQGNRALLNPAGDLFTNVVTNADKVVTQGLEFSTTALLGKRWSLSHRLAYFDADIDRWRKRFCSGDEGTVPGQVYCEIGDQPLVTGSKWSANTRMRYQYPWHAWRLYALLNWSWRSQFDEARLTDEFLTDKHRFNLSLGARSPQHNIDLQLWIKNLTNVDLNQSPGLQRNGDGSQPDAWRGNYSRGREVGVTLGYRF